MSSYEDEKRREQEEARIRSILRPQATDDPKKKRELEKQLAEARDRQRTGNFALVLIVALVMTVLVAVVRYLMGS